MPRISPSLFKQAYRISPQGAGLLQVCRDIPSALNELRWIREHVQSNQVSVRSSAEEEVRRLCRLRRKGIPLQYVLGTQPFGDLEIQCKPGVLIPRPETEAYTTHLAHLIRTGALLPAHTHHPGQPLSITDICTGTGCIALLLHALLQPAFPSLQTTGIDISPSAISLARANLSRARAHGHLPPPPAATQPQPQPQPQPQARRAIRFVTGDLFDDDAAAAAAGWLAPCCDVLVSNPPYVSASAFARSTARAVRNFEPRLALVPGPRSDNGGDGGGGGEAACAPEDVFYARLLDVAHRARPRVMLFEVGDLAQAVRVVRMVRGRPELAGAAVEVWRDWPDGEPGAGDVGSLDLDVERVPVRGSGHGRSVLVYAR